MPNSVDLDKYNPIKRIYNETDGKVQLCFLGTPNQAWHGLDIIEHIAQQLPQYHFHLIGTDGTNTSNLTYHGYLSSDQYNKILSQCHIAVGSLAMHRNGLSQACPLKVREYLLSGFPLIIGYDDIVNANSPKWCFKFETFNNSEIERLANFIETNKHVVVPVNDLSEIDVKRNEFKRVRFFESIQNERK
ncbi:glycosyltransferase family protein [Pseudoalteromonas xiamenensis]